MKKLKIWLLLDSSKAGGIESHVLQLAEGLFNHDQELAVIFLTNYGVHPIRDLLVKQGISSRTLDGSFITLYKALRRERPCLLHTHGYKAGIFGRLSAWLTKVAVISTYHAGEIGSGRLALYDLLDRLTSVFADHIFAVSPQIAKRLPGRAEVFNNFVNTAGLIDSRGKQIAFVGRVSEEKGPDYFMALADRFPALNFHLYGDGPQLPELKKSSPANLYIHGQQENMSTVWSQIALLVMPSRYEGLPMAALEAMARGIPVLAFRVGALDKLITSGSSGWLVEPENFTDLSRHISLWNNSSEQEKTALQSAAKNSIAEDFSSKTAIPKLIASYSKISSSR
ncbi:glycosyltransferase family 4 protein [Psychromonas aquimarina]|uniref:glycosyltransferase family 4 protein n=1 Tax=Psychromonas aquimarina TaxID=444919 RepID=UPI0004171099|nr:glycosyltransferase family 4 protein [Psychromonas aquimarina]